MIQLEAAYHSDRGRRGNNEDMYGLPGRLLRRPLDERGLAIQPPSLARYGRKGYLFLLADGVGGAEGGEEASRLMVAEVAARYYADPSADLMTSLRRVIEAGNRQLRRQRQEAGQRMATTLAAMVINRGRLFVAGVGDSRAYLIRGGQARLLTADHSWVQERLDRGELTVAEAARSPHRHRITRSLGSRDQVGVDTWQVDLAPGDRALLCSDGISGYLDEATLVRLAARPHLQQAVNSLIDTAYDNGSSDNMSAILVAVKQPSAGPGVFFPFSLS